MDIFTVIYTCTQPDETDSIPWSLSFTTLLHAKLHVLEEAAVCALHVQGIVGAITPLATWEEHDDYSTFQQRYSDTFHDSWMIIRTQLVDDSQVERKLDSAGLACYTESFRTQDGEPNLLSEHELKGRKT